MKLDFRSVLALAVPIIVLLFIAFLIFNWQMHYASFRVDLAIGGVWVGVVFLGLLSRPDHAPPARFLPRDMWDEHYGRQPIPVGQGAGSGAKSRRTFASVADGHVARSVGQLQRLVGRSSGHQPQLLRWGEVASA